MVKRYIVWGGINTSMEEREDGYIVKYNDYAALERELAIYKGREEAKQLVISQLERERDTLRADADRYRKALERIGSSAIGSRSSRLINLANKAIKEESQ